MADKNLIGMGRRGVEALRQLVILIFVIIVVILAFFAFYKIGTLKDIILGIFG